MRRRVLPWIEAALLLAALPLPWLLGEFWLTFATRIWILGLLALSFDLVWGYAGIMSFGQALFFGVGGYASALLATKLKLTAAALLLPGAALVGLVLAFIVAAIVIFGRRVPTVVFVALGTLTGSYVVERVARGWSYVGGQNGISSLPLLTVGGSQLQESGYYFVALGLLVVVYVLVRVLVRSQFGLVLAGIRERESRIEFFGYRVQNHKGVVFCLGGLIAGLSGGLYAFHEGFIGPGQIGPVLSTQAVVYVLFGGVGTLVGSLVGTTIIELVSFELPQIDWAGQSVQRFLDTGWPVVLGMVLLVTVMFQPAGLIGLLVSQRERVGSFGAPAEAGEPAEARHEPA